ncbi:N-formylglutamate amidohydrolase [Roseicella aquatilis]|uniref:N-formylglutamate amidohydrolase n=1 Tax=Roseicella aquatilis TaxID=2527868 RepID=A0A4R4D361_9PROT|nr:N-formylglutamate amidohydrolase [Roseicella aquatilis]TCZ52750.1 N-formylglutamate amidohydrolase [Roseicella aquatilis]
MSSGPAPVTLLNPEGAAACVLLCEHASNHVPAEYRDLGLPPEELQRHIAWDIGAAALAGRLSARLDAPLLLGGVSRLVIDLNRPPGSPTSIPEVSEATPIPGNRALSASERARREAAWFAPFDAAVRRVLDARAAAGRPTVVIGVHSFTPVYLGERRPWQAGVLYACATHFAAALVAALAAEPGLLIGDNQPYRIEPEMDWTVPVHGDARGLDAALIEVRQDLLAGDAAIEAWARRLARALRTAMR